MEWIEIAVSAIGGFSGAQLYRYFRRRNDYRYTWDCDEHTCTFHVATNNESILEALQLSHKHHHALKKGAEE